MRSVDAVIAALGEHPDGASSWLVGEPCVEPPAVLLDAFERAARGPRFPYAPPAGLPLLREVLASLHGEGGSAAHPDQVAVTAGAKGGLLALLAEVLEPGDEVIHPLPCYPAYRSIAARLGARGVGVAEVDGSLAGWADAVAGHIGPRTRAVIVASPSNPTGSTLASEDAASLVELCRRHGVRLICDEAYAEFRFADGCERVPADLDPQRRTVIQLRSASKSWALCGWRIGWIVADAELAARVASRHTSLVNPASGPVQAALTSLPEVPAGYLEGARAAVSDRITAVATVLERTGLAPRRPAGGFYLWLAVDGLSARTGSAGAAELCLAAAKGHGVGLWPGEDFGSSEHVRIAVTAPPSGDLAAALARLEAAMR